MATATARFSSTTGEGTSRASSPYSAAISRPVGVRGVGGGRVARGDGRLHLVGARAGRAAGRRPATPRPPRSRRRPSGTRSWSSSRTRSPASSTRVPRLASWKNISASRPRASGSSGMSWLSARASRIASAHRSPAHQVGARAGRVALVEQQVEHGQDAGRPVRQQVRGRHPVRDRRVADLVLGPDQALGHGLLGDHERPGDLRGGQPGQRAQRQGDPRLQRQRRVAAGEDQPEPVVGDAAVVVVKVGIAGNGQGSRLPQPGRLGGAAAEPVQRAVARHRGQPGAGTARDAVARPGLQCLREGVLRALLGQVPVAGHPDQGGHDPAPLLAERLGDRRRRRPSLTPPRTASPRASRTARPGAWTRPRWPRPGRRIRGCRTRRSAPWSRRTGRRRSAPRRRAPRPWWRR